MINFRLRHLIACLLYSATASLTAHAAITITFTAGSINQLELVRASGVTDTIVATETTGPMIADQIDLSYSDTFDFAAQSLPSGWSFQNIDVGSNKIATFYFTGTDSGNTSEFYDFTNPLTLNYTAIALSGMDTSVPFNIGGNVSDVTNFATVPLTGSFNASVIPEPSTISLLIGIAVMGTTLVFRRKLRRGSSAGELAAVDKPTAA